MHIHVLPKQLQKTFRRGGVVGVESFGGFSDEGFRVLEKIPEGAPRIILPTPLDARRLRECERIVVTPGGALSWYVVSICV